MILNGICSAELFNIKVLIPCDPLSLIEQAYGENWSLPMDRGYGFKNQQRGYYKYDKWSESRRYYNYYGNLNLNGTLEELNKHVGEDGIIKTNKIFDDII